MRDQRPDEDVLEPTKSKLHLLDVLAFAIGATLSINVNFGGELSIGEGLAVACCALVPRQLSSLRGNRWLQLLAALWVMWLVAQFASDVANSTPLQKILRLDTSIVFLFLSIVGLSALVADRPISILYILGGCAVASTLTMLMPSKLPPYSRWKWGAAGLAAFAVSGASSWLIMVTQRTFWAVALLIGAGIIGFFTDARSISAILMLIGIGILAHRYITSLPRGGASRPIALTLTVAGLIVTPIVIYLAYAAAASNGYLGQFAQNRYEMQTSSSSNPLMVSRIELLGSAQAIADRPVLGHGAWAENLAYINEVALMERHLGYVDPIILGPLAGRADSVPYIPIHSMVLGAWVWGGIAAPGMLVCMLVLGIRTLRTASLEINALTPAVLWCCSQLLWSLCFSPFSGSNRFDVALGVVVCIWFGRRLSNKSIQRRPVTLLKPSAMA